MRISDWSSDVCSSDLLAERQPILPHQPGRRPCRHREHGDHMQSETEIQKPIEAAPIEQEADRLAEWRRRGFYRVRRDEDRTRSEEHTSELQSLMRISYAVFCLKKKNKPALNSINSIKT